MKLVCISDTHNQYQTLDGKIPDGDILIHAGDLVRHGSIAEIQAFVDWYSQLPHRYKLFIGGNHDGALEHSRHLINIPNNLTYLENELIIIEGIRIWASPVSPPYRSFGFMWDDTRREELYKTVPECDIIINHSPPYGTIDTVLDGKSVGCKFLAAAIARVRPKLVICGHIHEAYGIVNKDGINYINPSIMNIYYQPVNAPIVIEI